MTKQSPADMWNARYAEQEYQFGVQPNDFLVEVTGSIPPGDVLCLADGEGRNGVYLAEQGYAVTSIDMASEGLKKAQNLAAQKKVDLILIEANILDYDLGKNSWDSIVSIFFHLPSAIRRPLHQRIATALKPGGVLVLEAYTPAQIAFGTGGPPIADNLMTLEALRGDFPDLVFEHAIEKEREVAEGRLHRGHSAVVQLVASKPS